MNGWRLLVGKRRRRRNAFFRSYLMISMDGLWDNGPLGTDMQKVHISYRSQTHRLLVVWPLSVVLHLFVGILCLVVLCL